ncbi:MAG: HDOD domain-containing protein [Desulfobacterales bacterium]
MATAEGLLKKFTTAKTLPHIAIRLTKLLSDDNSTMRDFEKMIKMDPTLVLRILRVANSPYYGLRQKVNNISRAVVVIGINNLRNMIVTDALKNIFTEDENNVIFSRSRLWLHCAAVSICSQMIMERIFGQNGEDAFLCGILHDIGMIVEDQTSPDLFAKVCALYDDNSPSIIDCEKQIVGTNHCEIGHLLARDWQLPEQIQEGIRQHHQSLDRVSPLSITGVIQMAEYIVSRLNYTAISGMKATLSSPLIEHIRENIKEYNALVRDLPDEMSKAKDLYAPYEEQN